MRSVDDSDHVIRDVREELELIQKWYPSNEHNLAALMEEVGELSNALLEQHRGNKNHADVYKEAIQVAAVAITIAMRGDSAFSYDPSIGILAILQRDRK